ncbi:MAG: hypothetical protein K2G83_00445 [Ruminococcus sp.]|nr:hypothetical protein [Ruminococcus sp.]
MDEERILITLKRKDENGVWKKRDVSVPLSLSIKKIGSKRIWKRTNGEIIDEDKSFHENGILNGELIIME